MEIVNMSHPGLKLKNEKMKNHNLKNCNNKMNIKNFVPNTTILASKNE